MEDGDVERECGDDEEEGEQRWAALRGRAERQTSEPVTAWMSVVMKTSDEVGVFGLDAADVDALELGAGSFGEA